MKRNPKPFSVEIKKSRVPGQRSSLLQQRLFETVPTETPKIVRTEPPQAVAEATATPRILPSIVEPAWSHPEPLEPVRRKRSSRAKSGSEQFEREFGVSTSEDVRNAPEEASVMLEQVPQRDTVSVAAEDAAPVHEAKPSGVEGKKLKPRQPRTKAFQAEEQGRASIPASEPRQIRETEVIGVPLAGSSQRASHRGLPRRQAAAIQLPRSERWKRRLHPAAW